MGGGVVSRRRSSFGGWPCGLRNRSVDRFGSFHPSRGGLGRPARAGSTPSEARVQRASDRASESSCWLQLRVVAAWSATATHRPLVPQLPYSGPLAGLASMRTTQDRSRFDQFRGVWTRQGPRLTLTPSSNHHAHTHINRAVSGQIRTLSSWAVTAAVCCRAS
jgi:hypothetical protein